MKYNDCNLRISNDYKQLGVLFCNTGSFNKNTEYAFSKGRSAIGATWQILSMGKNKSFDAAKKLFDSIVASTVL